MSRSGAGASPGSGPPLLDRSLREIRPEGRVVGRFVLLRHVEPAVPLHPEKDRAGAEGVVDGVDGSREPSFSFDGLPVREEGLHVGALLFDAREGHAAPLVGIPFPEELPRRAGRGRDDRPVVAGALGEDDEKAAATLREVLLEGVRRGEDDHLPDMGALGAELLDGLPGEGRDLGGELVGGGQLVGEAAGDADRPAGLHHVLQLDAGDAAELLPGAEAREVEKSPHGGLGELRVVPG